MQLIYRGHSYSCITTHTQPTCQPRVINWRYRSPLVDQIETLPVNRSKIDRYIQPRAINWRYQILMEV